MSRALLTLAYFVLTCCSIVFTACINNGKCGGRRPSQGKSIMRHLLTPECSNRHGHQLAQRIGSQFRRQSEHFVDQRRAHSSHSGGHRAREQVVVLLLRHHGPRQGLCGRCAAQQDDAHEEVQGRGVLLHGKLTESSSPHPLQLHFPLAGQTFLVHHQHGELDQLAQDVVTGSSLHSQL